MARCFSETFDGEGYGVAAAEAEGGDAALEVAALQFVEQRHEDARAARADRMAERDRSAVHVDLFWVEFELACDGNRGDGKSFVQLDEIHILIAVPASFYEQLFDRVYRRHHHPFRLDAADGLGDDARDGLLAEARGVAFARNNQRSRAIVRAWRVARGYCAIFLECGLQLRECLERSVFAR